uniref:Uncharacterized protein n=1 Tax=Caenorhabditis japonica TaxID=281687 RepID=A0A8R1IRJ1_CAEJA
MTQNTKCQVRFGHVYVYDMSTTCLGHVYEAEPNRIGYQKNEQKSVWRLHLVKIAFHLRDRLEALEERYFILAPS